MQLANSVLVTGANRGIGFEIVKQLLQSTTPPRHVFATYRNKDTVQALEQVASTTIKTQLVLIQANVTKKEDIELLCKRVEEVVGESGLNLLINNAGVLKYKGYPDVTKEDLLFHFNTNTVGPILILQGMLPLLQKAVSCNEGCMSVSKAAVLNISGGIGSIFEVEKYPQEFLQLVSYRTSKAALNMAMRVAGAVLKDNGVLVVNMCPGWVKTDMGTEKALIDATESVSSMLRTLPTLGESHQGSFTDRNGNTIPF